MNTLAAAKGLDAKQDDAQTAQPAARRLAGFAAKQGRRRQRHFPDPARAGGHLCPLDHATGHRRAKPQRQLHLALSSHTTLGLTAPSLHEPSRGHPLYIWCRPFWPRPLDPDDLWRAGQPLGRLCEALISLAIGLIYGLVSGYFGGTVRQRHDAHRRHYLWLSLLIFVILLQVYFKAVANRGGGGIIAAPVVALDDRQMGGMLFIFIAHRRAQLDRHGAHRAAARSSRIKEKEFIEGARSIGASDMRIVFRHLLPNILGPCIVAETMAIPGYIFTRGLSQLYRPGRQRAHAQLGHHGQRRLSRDALSPAHADFSRPRAA